jgi:glycosyltransferase involved in cell wall biosynthesis
LWTRRIFPAHAGAIPYRFDFSPRNALERPGGFSSSANSRCYNPLFPEPLLLSSLSVIIPAYNEVDRLPLSLERIVDHLSETPERPTEILVVNDGSSDGTAASARELAVKLERPNLSLRVLDNPGNRGKGYSVRHGMLEGRYDWLLFTDADLSAPIEELTKLASAVAGQGYDVAIGSRALDRSLIGVHQPWFRETLGRVFNLAVRVTTGLPFADTQCGFKLFRREAARKIFSRQLLERFGFDVEILYLAKKFGYRVIEVPVRWNHVEGTKVDTMAGADAFLDGWRVRRNDWAGKYDE